VNTLHPEPSPLGRPLLLSALLHLAALLLLFAGERQAPPSAELKVRMVRLGGGQNRPGWVDDRPRAVQERPGAPAARPAEEAPAPAEPRPDARSEPAAEPRAAAREPARRAPTATEPVRERPSGPGLREVAPSPAALPPPMEAADRAAAPAGEHARAAGDGLAADASPATAPAAGGQSAAAAGPAGEGLGRGAAPDPEARDLPGLAGYLQRLEGSIQRQFRYPATGSGRRCVYHFRVERDGRVTQLELRQASELPGMDLAARGAIQRAVIPPLPPGFPAARLGVTYTFIDE
jgi:TonB family protein